MLYKMRTPYILFAFAVLFHFTSCVPQRKAASAKIQLATVDSQLLQNGKTLSVLNNQTKIKQEQNELDDTASNRIQKFIGNTDDEINKLHVQNETLISDTNVDRNDWNRLKTALTLSQKSLKAIAEKVSFINDLITRNTVVKLDQDILFKPGQYQSSEDVARTIGGFFEPAAKEIDYFFNKYPSFPLSLVITAKGYADATTISETSSLYKDLKDKLKLQTDNPDSKELNKALSNERAKEVIGLFKKFTVDRSAAGGVIKNILYIYEGKGESLPDPKISDYRIDDPRRRVVLLFWSVFPE
jgi:hypothetical protein